MSDEIKPTANIEQVNIEEELKTSYLAYSVSVIVGRALPDVRDGLKPVHRRILYAMSKIGCDKMTKKSARIVGDVIGKYHPHGDSAAYDALVRLAQPFNMRYCLVDGQGNFGSEDGDPPAHMRYTEAKLAKNSASVLCDLDKETVDFIPISTARKSSQVFWRRGFRCCSSMVRAVLPLAWRRVFRRITSTKSATA